MQKNLLYSLQILEKKSQGKPQLNKEFWDHLSFRRKSIKENPSINNEQIKSKNQIENRNISLFL